MKLESLLHLVGKFCKSLKERSYYFKYVFATFLVWVSYLIHHFTFLKLKIIVFDA
jgi:hypothetical protein